MTVLGRAASRSRWHSRRPHLGLPRSAIAAPRDPLAMRRRLAKCRSPCGLPLRQHHLNPSFTATTLRAEPLHAANAVAAHITNISLEHQSPPMPATTRTQHTTTPPSRPCPTPSPHASSASAQPQPTSAWTRNASTARCGRASRSFQSARTASPSTTLTSTPGPTSINVETGVPRPTGASHGTKQ